MYNTLDQAIKSALENFNNQLEEVSFDDSSKTFSFTLGQNRDKLEELAVDKNLPGVYFFEMKVPSHTNFGKDVKIILQNFKNLWSHPDYHKRWTPSVKDSRIKVHNSFKDDWIPLYIGKSRCLGKRIKEHIEMDLTKTTFAMKLNARKNLHGIKFRVRYIKIEVNNYNMIVPHVESRLRDRYNPIVGRQ